MGGEVVVGREEEASKFPFPPKKEKKQRGKQKKES
jgi:hypothetical protein